MALRKNRFGGAPDNSPPPSPMHQGEDVGRVPVSVPMLYGDQVLDVVYGVHTTKLVLGIENGSGGSRPDSVIVLPTAALFHACMRVIATLSSPEILQQTEKRLAEATSMMRGARPSPLPAVSRAPKKTAKKAR